MLEPERLRRDFPILSRKVRGRPLVYLDNAATTQKPRAVLDALVSFYSTSNANIHRGVHTLSDEATQQVEDSRANVARFIGAADPRTVVFTRNATEAINLVAHAWGRGSVGPGDEILLTELEHHSNLVPWQFLARERQARLRFVPVEPDGTLDLEAARRLLASGRVRLAAFTAASNALGTLTPVEKLLGLARQAGAATLVDASQWTPHRPTDVAAWGCDFLAFSAHKMLGPTGIGVLYGREPLLEAMDPFLGGGDMIREVAWESSTYNDIPYKFEAGTPNIADAVAFGAAIDYLRSIGMEGVMAHEEALTRRCLDLLRAEPEVTVYGPSELSQRGGVVSFNVNGLHPHDVGTALDLEGIAVRAGHHCCQPLMRKLGIPGTARASFYLYNTLEEVSALAAALRRTIAFFKGSAAAGRR